MAVGLLAVDCPTHNDNRATEAIIPLIVRVTGVVQHVAFRVKEPRMTRRTTP